MDSLVGPVNFVDNYNHPVAKLECPAEDESGLGHRAFRSIHQQNDAVDHFQDTFHFSAEVRMARSIHDVDFCVAIPYGCVFSHNSDAALAFEIIGVHYAVHNLLIFSVDAGLLQQFIHESRFAVVDMGDNRYISQLIHKFSSLFFNISQQKRILALEEIKRNYYNRNV